MLTSTNADSVLQRNDAAAKEMQKVDLRMAITTCGRGSFCSDINDQPLGSLLLRATIAHSRTLFKDLSLLPAKKIHRTICCNWWAKQPTFHSRYILYTIFVQFYNDQNLQRTDVSSKIFISNLEKYKSSSFIIPKTCLYILSNSFYRNKNFAGHRVRII